MFRLFPVASQFGCEGETNLAEKSKPNFQQEHMKKQYTLIFLLSFGAEATHMLMHRVLNHKNRKKIGEELEGGGPLTIGRSEHVFPSNSVLEEYYVFFQVPFVCSQVFNFNFSLAIASVCRLIFQFCRKQHLCHGRYLCLKMLLNHMLWSFFLLTLFNCIW